jgi:hypothetical protein
VVQIAFQNVNGLKLGNERAGAAELDAVNQLGIDIMSETRIRDLAGIITRDFRGIKNVNFATLLLSSEAEADREQARADI